MDILKLKDFTMHSKLPINDLTPRETPIWERQGDFSWSPYASSVPLNRTLTFVNKAPSPKVKQIRFLGYDSHRLRVAFEFVTSELSHEFFKDLPDQISIHAFTSETLVYVDFSSQKHFDQVFKLFHSLYPLNPDMLSNLPCYLNTRVPKRVTESDWLKSYPLFNPDFLAITSRFAPENGLSYALNMHKPGPELSQLATYNRQSTQLHYVVTEINHYFSDNKLAVVAQHETGKLPPLKKGYYITSLHHSSEQIMSEYYQMDDFHFIVQNNDGLFSHRRGDKHPPERVDSQGKLITSPESAILSYIIDDATYPDDSSDPPTYLPVRVDYRFIGYIYLKTNETRMRLSNEGLELLDNLEKKAEVEPDAQNKLSKFKGRFFMYPPIPEFFADARKQLEDLDSVTSHL